MNTQKLDLLYSFFFGTVFKSQCKYYLYCTSQIGPATLHELTSHTRLAASILDSTAIPRSPKTLLLLFRKGNIFHSYKELT